MSIEELDPDGDPRVVELVENLRQVIFDRVAGTKITVITAIGALHYLAHDLSQQLWEDEQS